MMEQDYMDITGDAFSDMRVLIEGAISLYENHTSELSILASEHGMDEARTALNDVGGALYTMRQHIRKLQSAHLLHVDVGGALYTMRQHIRKLQSAHLLHVRESLSSEDAADKET